MTGPKKHERKLVVDRRYSPVSATTYKESWSLTLECGHTLLISRGPAFHNADTVERKFCPDCAGLNSGLTKEVKPYSAAVERYLAGIY